MNPEEPDKVARKGGLFDSVKSLAATLLGMGQTRLELLSTELEEERAWLTAMMVWVLIAMFFAALAIVLATILVVIVFWDSYRLQAISVLIFLFIAASAIAWRVVFTMSRKKPRLFSASLAEIAKDRELLATPFHE